MKFWNEPAAAAENAAEMKKFVSCSSSLTEHWNQHSGEARRVDTLLCQRQRQTTTQTFVHLAHLTETGNKGPLFSSWRGRQEVCYASVLAAWLF